jgi:hypothetical protein
MEPVKVIQIAQKIVTFFLTNNDAEIRTTYKNMIKISIAELGPYLESDAFLCEEYVATMIAHRIPALPTPKNDPDFFDKLLNAIESSVEELMDWIMQVKANNEMGLCFNLKKENAPPSYLN